MEMTNFQAYSRVDRSMIPEMAATPRTDLVSLTLNRSVRAERSRDHTDKR